MIAVVSFGDALWFGIGFLLWAGLLWFFAKRKPKQRDHFIEEMEPPRKRGQTSTFWHGKDAA